MCKQTVRLAKKIPEVPDEPIQDIPDRQPPESPQQTPPIEEPPRERQSLNSLCYYNVSHLNFF